MKVAIIQGPLAWEDAEINRQYFKSKIDSIERVDLIVLPEMFASGFTMIPQNVAESMDGMTVIWMQALAKARNCAITGSLVIKDEGLYYNRLLFVMPSGKIHHYDKRHLFTLAGENKSYTAGQDRITVEYMGWKICPLVCYDLRFPVFSRNTDDYDLLIYVANWPAPRIAAWDILLRARAVENLCYVIGNNRIGADDLDNQYIGHSQIVDHMGALVCDPTENESVLIATLDREAMLESRKKLGFLNDRDQFTVA